MKTPGITTNHQPCEGIAHAAFDRLLTRMSDRALMTSHILLPYTLEIRGLTSAVAQKS